MSFAEDIAKVSEQVRKRKEVTVGEEATKMALIAPFLASLGYDIFDPSEVMPEYVADFAVKVKPLKKVDYAIAINTTIVILVEAKARGEKPEAHDGQLAYYFNSLISAKVGIVSNGLEYRFHTDLREKNVMDKDPFFIFNILDYDTRDIENLKFFHKDNFDAAAIGKHAEEMVYVKAMTRLVGDNLRAPSEPFIRFFIKELGYSGTVNAKVIKQFEPIVKKSIQISLVDLMTRSINQEMSQTSDPITPPEEEEDDTEAGVEADDSKIVTTAEEMEAFNKIKTIVATSKEQTREIGHKDVIAYFGVHTGKPGWWFLRLYLSSKKKNIVTRLPIDEAKELAPSFEVQEMSASFGDAASRVFINSVDDIDKLSSLILRCYEVEAAKH